MLQNLNSIKELRTISIWSYGIKPLILQNIFASKVWGVLKFPKLILISDLEVATNFLFDDTKICIWKKWYFFIILYV